MRKHLLGMNNEKNVEQEVYYYECNVHKLFSDKESDRLSQLKKWPCLGL